MPWFTDTPYLPLWKPTARWWEKQQFWVFLWLSGGLLLLLLLLPSLLSVEASKHISSKIIKTNTINTVEYGTLASAHSTFSSFHPATFSNSWPSSALIQPQVHFISATQKMFFNLVNPNDLPTGRLLQMVGNKLSLQNLTSNCRPRYQICRQSLVEMCIK